MAQREARDVGVAVRFEVNVENRIFVAAIFGCGHLKVAATFFVARR
jgi:hypothetical protein